MAYAPTILQSNLFLYVILPFLLVFTIVFAILEKSKILGDGKRQVNAIVALVVGLIVVAFGSAVDMIVNLMPFLAVSLVILLVFMILWSSVFVKEDFKLGAGVVRTVGVLVTIALVIAVLVVTGGWDYLKDLYNSSSGSTIISNAIVIVIVAVAVIALVVSAKPAAEAPKKG